MKSEFEEGDKLYAVVFPGFDCKAMVDQGLLLTFLRFLTKEAARRFPTEVVGRRIL